MEMILIIASAILMILLIVIIIMLNRQNRTPEHIERLESDAKEMIGRLKTLSESGHNLTQTLDTKIETLRGSIDQKMTQNTERTNESLAKMHERLGIIDRAEKNIQTLSSHINDLQKILSDKQLRGAFGEARMEAIIRDALPAYSYEFQHTLSNGTRPDCIIRLPNQKQKIVIDAKFPLEAFKKLRGAQSQQEQDIAMREIKKTIADHIKEISKYIIQDETYDPILMFIPSESIFAELYESFEEIFQHAYRAGVAVISPNIMMVAIQTLQAIMKDEKMRSQAASIKKEVGLLIEDVGRLQKRVDNLQSHFGQTSKDINEILISTGKITSRGEKIGNVELENTHQNRIEVET